MFGVRQAMYDIKREVDRLDRHTLIDDIDTRCSYPYNWIPPRVREAHVGALIGAHNILLVVHVILQDGAIPNVSAIRDLCEKEAHQLPYTDEYIQGGGSVVHILEELTTQVEGDMRGDALHVDSEDLLETMEQARPCALDETLLGWRRAIGISE
ncbi:hypothetical protein IWW50_005896 [Coemansia erecta]|nr:hypothetical protein IWW50_005896 [Coemansia erecta]